MMRILISALICGIALASVAAFASDRLTAPDRLDRKISTGLDNCSSQAAKSSPAENQILASGYDACYSHAMEQWKAQIGRARSRIAESADIKCKAMSDDLEKNWDQYRNSTLSANAIGDLPLNTDDDLEIRLLKNLYEMNYALAENYGCKQDGAEGK